MNQAFYEELTRENPNLSVLLEEPMQQHTTFRIGGPAEYFAQPDEKELISICRLTAKHDIPLTIIGNGSNLLVLDGGIRGMVVSIGKNMADIRRLGGGEDGASEESDACRDSSVPGAPAAEQDSSAPGAPDCIRIYAGAGAMMASVAGAAAREGLTGMEFAAGIPGSIGGAVVMNAGAYGGEMKDILESVRVLATDGTTGAIGTPAAPCSSTGGPDNADTFTGARILDIPVEELDLSYRHSIIPERGYIVLGAAIALKKGDREAIEARMAELRDKRQEKQPLNYPSAGSTFKRPEGYFAGKLIEDAGLRGYRVGDAQISEKHCGFVVNCGSATASDVTRLIADVAAAVREKFGVDLEPEVKIIGSAR